MLILVPVMQSYNSIHTAQHNEMGVMYKSSYIKHQLSAIDYGRPLHVAALIRLLSSLSPEAH